MSTPTAFMVQKADVIIIPFEGGVLSKKRYLVNYTELNYTAPTAESTEFKSNMRSIPSPLKIIPGEAEAPQITLAFNYASNKDAVALNMGGHAERIPANTGSVVDGEFSPAPINQLVFLDHHYIDVANFELKDTNGEFTAGEDYSVDLAFGVVTILSDKLAKATGVTTSYSYNEPEKTRLNIGANSSFTAKVIFSGINAFDDKMVSGEIYEAFMTPSGDSALLTTGEATVFTLNGKLSIPAGKKFAAHIDMEE